MKLTRARVRNYKSIDDSSWVNIEDITALVGKNESGKTAFLQALRKINSYLEILTVSTYMITQEKGISNIKKCMMQSVDCCPGRI
ncbi:MAG: hypothetical protein CM1200mP3_12110 [Chloroflexota bacterium]|nr:MAG: hypothetical protein CM1200mP3_12110 [Chloroflexota bacterium]